MLTIIILPHRDSLAFHLSTAFVPPPSFSPNMLSSTKTITDKKIDVEQSLQEIVTVNGGTCYSNEQMADLFSQNLCLREANIKHRTWIHALTGLVMFLTISNMAALLVAVRISKSLLVDPTSGALTIQGSNTRVSTIATGEEHVFTWLEGADHVCVSYGELGQMWNSTMTGTPTSAVFNTVDENGEIKSINGLSFVATGSLVNDTHMCLMASDGHSQKCADFTSDNCGNDGRRALENKRRILAMSSRDATFDVTLNNYEEELFELH
jgi:hypothetical protein